MRRTPITCKISTAVCFLLPLALPAGAGAPSSSATPPSHNVLMHHNDAQRTGQMRNETLLTPTSIYDPANQGGKFGKLFSQPVDAGIYAQPLYMENLPILNKGVHNVVFVATEHASLYAFDADNAAGANSLPLWHTSFIDPANGITTVSNVDVNTGDIVPEIGITGTPVIDADNGVLYLVVKTKEPALVGQGVRFVQRLHAINIHTGLEGPGSPIEIQAVVPGSGEGSFFQDGQNVLAFDPFREHQRAALLLLNGSVYIAWASHSDNRPYHGWLIGYKYNGQSFTQVGAYNTTPNGGMGGIWMSGNGPSADADGNIYLETGNGTFDAGSHVLTINGNRQFYPAADNFGNSLLKISAGGNALNFVDYFTPANQDFLNGGDEDFGSGAALVLPDANPDGTSTGNRAHPHILVGSGKEGKIYVVDRDNLGQYGPYYNPPLGDRVIMETATQAIGGTWNMPAYFNGHLYYQGVGDVLSSFVIANGVLTGPVSRSSKAFLYPGATPSISANGVRNGIVWVLENSGLDWSSPVELHAYDAADLTKELYNSSQEPNGRDVSGAYVTFAVPTVANGHVYVGSYTELTVYGLNPGQSRIPPIRFDFNADGHADLLFQSQSNGSVAYVTLNGLGFLTSDFMFPTVQGDYKVVAAPDLNGDGAPDILFQSPSTGQVAYVLLNGLVPTGQYGFPFDTVPAGYQIVGTPDLNGDGQPDVLLQNRSTGEISYVLMNGVVSGETGYMFHGIDPDLKLVGTPCLKGDGHPDLLFQNTKTGDILYALMNGTSPLTPTSYGTLFYGVPLEYQLVGTPDLNADGSEDLVFQGQTTGDVSYVLMNGLTPVSFGYLVHGVDLDYKIVGIH